MYTDGAKQFRLHNEVKLEARILDKMLYVIGNGDSLCNY
jgi:hypothetical protein